MGADDARQESLTRLPRVGDKGPDRETPDRALSALAAATPQAAELRTPEARRERLRRVAAEVPHELRKQQGEICLEVFRANSAVQEVTCPACAGTSWLDLEALEICPICYGFQEVPTRLAKFVRIRMRGGCLSVASGQASVSLSTLLPTARYAGGPL